MQCLAAALLMIATATGQQPVLISTPPSPSATHDRIALQQCFNPNNACVHECFSSNGLALQRGARYTLSTPEVISVYGCVDECLRPKTGFNHKE